MLHLHSFFTQPECPASEWKDINSRSGRKHRQKEDEMSTEPIGTRTQVANADVMATNTAHRTTPSDGPTFGEVMKGSAHQLLRGASAAVRVLPSGPIVAASVRPGGIAVSPGAVAGVGGGMRADGSAEGAGAPGQNGPVGDEAVESALARSQEMNMYMIELQERVSAQNRAFTTYSNVLKAKHDTVKNAINNIR